MSRAGNHLPLREKKLTKATASPQQVDSKELGGCWDRDLKGEGLEIKIIKWGKRSNHISGEMLSRTPVTGVGW